MILLTIPYGTAKSMGLRKATEMEAKKIMDAGKEIKLPPASVVVDGKIVPLDADSLKALAVAAMKMSGH